MPKLLPVDVHVKHESLVEVIYNVIFMCYNVFFCLLQAISLCLSFFSLRSLWWGDVGASLCLRLFANVLSLGVHYLSKAIYDVKNAMKT